MPNPNTKGISVHVDRELHAEITAYLQENNMKMADFITLAAQELLRPQSMEINLELQAEINAYLEEHSITMDEFFGQAVQNELHPHIPDEKLIAEVNAVFGTELDPEDFSAIMNYANHQLVEIAKSQLGNVGGEPYWSWYGFGGRVEWCACFVSWCADQCGYIDKGIIPKFAVCGDGVDWFKAKSQWLDGTGTPAPGNIIFFDWPDEYGVQDGDSDHVGIVEKVEGGRVYTIEGNSGDACERNSYPVGNYQILGYGTPAL